MSASSVRDTVVVTVDVYVYGETVISGKCSDASSGAD